MQEHPDTAGFDFDAWAELAKNSPDEFEIKRKKAIEAVISNAPQRCRTRLRQIQWKLDRIRDTSPNPMAACIRMQDMLWESVLGEEGLLARLRQTPVPGRTPPRNGHILDFRR